MNSPRIFVARLLGLDVFDPLGDRLGRLRDVVVLDRGRTERSVATGLVIEVPGKKRVFVPMTRVTSLDSGQIITTGLINLRRFSRRGAEQTVAGDLFDRRVDLVDGSGPAVIEDLGLEQQRNGDWLVSDLYAATPAAAPSAAPAGSTCCCPGTRPAGARPPSRRAPRASWPPTRTSSPPTSPTCSTR